MLEGFTNSGAERLLTNINIESQEETILQDVIVDNQGVVSVNKQGTNTFPWPEVSRIEEELLSKP